MIVWLSGPTGSGKSTMAEHLAEVGYAIVREDLPQGLFKRFRDEPVTYCAELQEAIMRGRGEGWDRICDRSHIAFDRSVDEDVAVFCRMHAERALIDDYAMSHLRSVASEVRMRVPSPDLIIYPILFVTGRFRG